MTNRNGPPEKIWRLAGSISQPGPKTEARACPSLFSAPSPTWEHCLRIKIPSCCAEARSKAQPLNDRSSLPLSDIDSQEEPQREHTPFIRSCMCGLNLVTHPCCQPERSVAGDWSCVQTEPAGISWRERAELYNRQRSREIAVEEKQRNTSG
jgi:hypothetical protein